METITFLLVSYTIAYLCTELETTNNNLLLLKIKHVIVRYRSVILSIPIRNKNYY